MSAILRVDGLSRTFGAVIAACDITLTVERGEVLGIIGANGAGKTTFVNMVTGYTKPTSGSIHFEERDITRLRPREITNLGINRSFQVPQVFDTVSVFENVLLALGIARSGSLPLWQALDRPKLLAAAEGVLERYGIASYRDQEARLLPQGVRKLLDIAMATVHEPRILLLDEPTSGISAEEKFGLMDIIMEALRAESVTVLFVEHDMEIVARYASRVLAFYDGTVIADGPPDTVLADPDVRVYVIGEELHRSARAAPGAGDAAR